MVYLGKTLVPGVKSINVGKEGVQLNFMEAHHKGEPTTPQINIDLFCNHAKDLFDLVKVDIVLISCSTMNRTFKQSNDHMKLFDVPVVQEEELFLIKLKMGGTV